MSQPSSNGKPVQPISPPGSSEEYKSAAGLAGSSFSLDDAISMHLVDCDQCRSAALAGPVKLGEKSRHCTTYFELQLMRAEYEGQVNNIVRHDEHGNLAPLRGHLEP